MVNTKSVIDHAIRTLKAVANWTAVKSFLKNEGLPVTRGFDELQSRLLDLVEMSNDGGIDIATKITNFLTEYHLHGEKQITFYAINEQYDDDLDSAETVIEAAFSKFEVEESDATSAFPFALLDSELGDGDSAIRLVNVRNDERYTDLVFSITISGDVKETFIPSNVEKLPPSWIGSEQIIVVRKRSTQVLPVVTYDKQSKIIQIKVPMMGSFALEDVVRNNVVNQLNRMMRQSIDKPIHIGRTMNLYPAISKIYLNTAEGKIVELGYNTATGSAKLERMKSDDLREELWHHAGKSALQALSSSSLPFIPFRLAVRWDIDGDSIDLILPGTTRNVSAMPYLLHHAKISGTVKLNQFQSRVDTLLSYLP